MSYKDFDIFFEEMEEENPLAVSIKVFDKKYFLPTDVSAITVLLHYRANQEGRSELLKSEELVLMFELLGQNNIEEWTELGMTQRQLYTIFKWVLAGCPSDKLDKPDIPEEAQSEKKN